MRAYVHATVIDVTGTAPLPDHTVLVDGDRIAAVGPTTAITVPEGVEVVDLTGRFLLPGLTDAHTHSDGDEHVVQPSYVVHGVTAVREMWGSDDIRDVRDRVEAGKLLGPRSVGSGNLIDGSPSLWEDFAVPKPPTIVADSAEARRAVAETQDAGADFVKVYSRLNRESHRAILDEARRRDIPVAGHRSDHVPFSEQIESGQRSFEHVHGLWPALCQDPETLEAAWARIRIEPDTYYASWFRQVNEVEWEAANTYSPVRATEVFRRLVANDVAYCPTLVMHRYLDLPERLRLDDRRLCHTEPDTARMWEFVLENLYLKGRTHDESAKRRVLFDLRRAVVGAMADAGVRMIAGTDVHTPGVLPGYSLHEELELYVDSGLSPLHALRTATIEPARFLGRESWSGSVEQGKVADLLVLDADPLADIRNTTRIHAVVARGRHIGPRERADLLTEIASRAKA
ncbi:amidohydrolase family protein [Nocardiopsis sp. NPDC055551]